MKVYTIAELEITDPRWVADYVKHVTPLVERAGGRYLARTPKLEKIEGDRKPPQIVLVLEWPSREAVFAFYESEEYRPYREARLAGSRGEFLLVQGEDVSGIANIAG